MITTLKSGNWGHVGRPGQVGGSGVGDEHHAVAAEVEILGEVIAAASGWAGVSHAERGKVKAKIVRTLAPIMERLDPQEYLSIGRRDSPQQIVQEQLDKWAETSGDSDERAIGMQISVMKEFGLEEKSVSHLPGGSGWDTHDSDLVYLRAEYQNTQKFFKDKGITHVSLFRGVGNTQSLREGEQEIMMAPASAWSTDLDTALQFANGRPHSHILTTRVPVERVLSTCVTGRGCLSEAEVIVLGGKTKVNSFPKDERLGRAASSGLRNRVLKSLK
jgi:hypothetical protein